MVDLTIDDALNGPADMTAGSFVDLVFAGPALPAYPRDKVQAIAEAVLARCAEFGYRPSLVAGQMLHETGYFWSRVKPNQVQPEQNNWAGLGATNDGAKGATFATVDDGVLAVCCHRALYQYGEPDRWPEHLRQYASRAIRLQAVRWADANIKRPDGTLLRFLGACSVVRDFVNGRWAWSPQYPYGSLDNGYAKRMVEIANTLRRHSAMPNTNPVLGPVPGLATRVSFIPAGNGNRPALPMTPRFITVHTTANKSVGANAEMHRRFTHAGGGSGEVSFHWAVDDDEAIQLLPHNENGWHAGDGYDGTGNRASIAIEICENADGDFWKAVDNACRLIAALRKAYGIPAANVVQHNRWSGKWCPSPLRNTPGAWESLLTKVDGYLNGFAEPAAPGVDPNRRYFEETGHWLHWGFRGHWEKYGATLVFGFPLTGEFKALDSGLTTQVFERYVMEFDPDAPPEWQVRGRHLRGLNFDAIVPAEAWAREAK